MASARTARGLHKLFVGNLPWTVGNQELRSYFKDFGKIVNATVVFDKKTGLSKGYGFVSFTNLSILQKIENEPKHLLEGNYLNIQKQS